jgi:hypothetical protein
MAALREMIAQKCQDPINPGNRKIIIFTAFADTAIYLYSQLATWAKETIGVESALVTGTGGNQTTLPGLRRDLGSILTSLSPRSKERPEELAGEGELDLLIATDCISEGQNLQDCDWLINYDIHWNPVRIIQRFGHIDRIGSPNSAVQLVNFWPNMELDEYINLEQRVSGRMVLLDISATGEENLIQADSGNPMNDLEYRRKQLLKLQDAVIDMEDLSSGVFITDLNLIMRDKEKLLSLATPLKFIFSHSALREGWDNPNVFQICTLREIQSERMRRQTIGRGLRLCVNQKGERERGFDINTLTVIATESFEQFAENLQKEVEQDTGIRFGIVEKHQFAAIALTETDGQLVPLGLESSEIQHATKSRARWTTCCSSWGVAFRKALVWLHVSVCQMSAHQPR